MPKEKWPPEMGREMLIAEMKKELRITSDHDHRSWSQIRAALAASGPQRFDGEKDLEQFNKEHPE